MDGAELDLGETKARRSFQISAGGRTALPMVLFFPTRPPPQLDRGKPMWDQRGSGHSGALTTMGTVGGGGARSPALELGGNLRPQAGSDRPNARTWVEGQRRQTKPLRGPQHAGWNQHHRREARNCGAGGWPPINGSVAKPSWKNVPRGPPPRNRGQGSGRGITSRLQSGQYQPDQACSTG